MSISGNLSAGLRSRLKSGYRVAMSFRNRREADFGALSNCRHDPTYTMSGPACRSTRRENTLLSVRKFGDTGQRVVFRSGKVNFRSRKLLFHPRNLETRP